MRAMEWFASKFIVPIVVATSGMSFQMGRNRVVYGIASTPHL